MPNAVLSSRKIIVNIHRTSTRESCFFEVLLNLVELGEVFVYNSCDGHCYISTFRACIFDSVFSTVKKKPRLLLVSLLSPVSEAFAEFVFPSVQL